MRKTKLYIYINDGKETIFKVFNKRDIMDYLKTTKYDILKNCWEESSSNINYYYNEGIIYIDLTKGELLCISK